MKKSVLYLGCKYNPRIIHAKKSRILIRRNTINIHIANNLDQQIFLNQWYKDQALIIFNQRAKRLVRKLKLNIKPVIKIRKMSACWGTCSQDGTIKINPLLIKTPEYCIDYVIMHELCHLIEFNHSSNFWNLLEKVMPDYKSRQDWLDNQYNISKLIF